MTTIADLTFDPDAVYISRHAQERYQQRRDTNPQATHRGIMRLLTLASQKPLPPIKVMKGRAGREFCAGGFFLILNTRCTQLITIIADPRTTKRRPRHTDPHRNR